MKRYLITGASRGIGRAIAIRLAKPDTEIILHGRDQEALVDVFTEVEAAGGKPQIETADFSKSDDVIALANKVAQRPLDALINNAGIAGAKPLGEISLEDWRQIFAINVTAPFLLSQKLVPIMPRGASIVNMLSVAAHTAYPEWSSYCMSKFAFDGFSRAIREELRDSGVRVINIYPGAVATDIWDHVPGEQPLENMMSPDEIAASVAFALERPGNVLIEDVRINNQKSAF